MKKFDKSFVGRDCPKGQSKCPFCSYGGSEIYCKHPALGDNESLSSLPYCPYEKYTEIAGKWLWDEDVKQYISHIVRRLRILTLCDEIGCLPVVNSSQLEFERQELHEKILEDAHVCRDSDWISDLQKYVEEKAAEILKREQEADPAIQ